MKIKTWVTTWFVIVIMAFVTLGSWVYRVDPFFHYHKPDTDKYFYTLNNERSQNDGIIRHFDYDAMITGTSMTQNFKSSEFDQLFGVSSIKVPFAGGTFKEINENIDRALTLHPDVKTVVRGIDVNRLSDAVDSMRLDLGEYPTYLYDDDPFNDVNYVLNREVIFGRVYDMYKASTKDDFTPGITSFDKYSRWQEKDCFGLEHVRAQSADSFEKEITEVTNESDHLSDKEKKVIKAGVESNIVSLADKYPDVTFYYFYTPYSAAAWRKRAAQTGLHKRVESIEYATELILPYENIKLFCFDTRFDITTDLNNYSDNIHYAGWVNSLMLKWMHEDKYRLTSENYKEVMQEIFDYYVSYDFDSLYDQEDYEADLLAGALLNKELTGAEPLNLLSEAGEMVKKGESGIEATADLDKGYNYLMIAGKSPAGKDSIAVEVQDEAGKALSTKVFETSDDKEGIYVIDLSEYEGKVTVAIASDVSQLKLY